MIVKTNDPKLKWIGTYVGETKKEAPSSKVLLNALTMDDLQTGIFKNKVTGEFYTDETYCFKKKAGLPTIDLENILEPSPIYNVIDVSMSYGADVFKLAEEYDRTYRILSLEQANCNDLYVGYISTPTSSLNTYGHGLIYDFGIAIMKDGYMGGFCKYVPSHLAIMYKELIPLTKFFPSLANKNVTLEEAQRFLERPFFYKRYMHIKERQNCKCYIVK